MIGSGAEARLIVRGAAEAAAQWDWHTEQSALYPSNHWPFGLFRELMRPPCQSRGTSTMEVKFNSINSLFAMLNVFTLLLVNSEGTNSHFQCDTSFINGILLLLDQK